MTINGKLCRKLGLGSAAMLVAVVGLAETALAQVDEVVVTATKREKSIQDIPVSVTALSADALTKDAVTNLDSLQHSVPGLSMTTGAGSGWQSSLRMRGIGTSGTNIGFEGSVGIFVDGVFRPRAGASLNDLADVERVEVLRGPQGTLFGRNTTAGAVSIVTKKPVMDETSASFRLTGGNLNRIQISGIFNTPLSDKMAARLSADYNKRDGFLENQVDGVSDLNDRDRINLRGQLLWEPNPEMEVRVIGNHFSVDEACCGSSVYLRNPLLDMPTALEKAVPSADLEDFETARNGDTIEKQDETGLQIDYEWNMSNGITFFNSAAYSDYEMSGQTDADQSALDFINQPSNFVKQKQFSNEARFSGVMDDLSSVQSIAWIAGAYYSKEALGLIYNMEFGADANGMQATLEAIEAPGFSAATGFTTGDKHNATMSQDAEVTALFAHADIDINERWAASVGTRFTSEEKTGRGVFVTNHNPARINLFASEGARDFVQTNDIEESIVNLTLTSKLSDDVSVYESYADGYKSGGFNLDVLGGQAGATGGTPRSILGWGGAAEADPSSVPVEVLGILAASETNPAAALNLPDLPGDPSFATEFVDTYELGLKSVLMDGRATLNATAFTSVFENYQLLHFTGTGFTIFSVPEVTTSGFETDVQVNLTEGLNIGVQYTLAETEYTAPFSLTFPEMPPRTIELNGRQVNNAPEHTASLSAGYEWPLANSDLKGSVYGALNYSSEYNADAGLDDARVQDDYTMYTARAGISRQDDSLGLEIWCRNCTDEAVAQIIFRSPVADGAHYAFMNPSQEWGVTLKARY